MIEPTETITDYIKSKLRMMDVRCSTDDATGVLRVDARYQGRAMKLEIIPWMANDPTALLDRAINTVKDKLLEAES